MWTDPATSCFSCIKNYDFIKGDNKRDDLASMHEVVYRRLFKIISDNDYKPDLIIVDGGINQLNAIKEIISSLDLEINQGLDFSSC